MALKKSELYSSLWASCDELRGGMDASQYKDYVLVLLFVKYVSDRYADQPYAPISIPDGASFADMVALKGKPDVGDQINKKILGPLAQANKLSDMPDFNDPNKLGSGKEMVERLTNLISIFENPALDFSQNRADGDDLLGDAYEYLMRHFATESGKSKGQFYTPAEVSRIIAQILGIRHAKVSNDTTVYDPTCGSGSLLLKIGDEARHDGKNVKVTLYGQEKDNATAGLARMNMILHDYATADIKQGNMRHLIDTYIEADDPRTISNFGEIGLLDLIVKSGLADAISQLPPGIRGNRDAVAETIVNNVRSKIVKDHLNDPAFYDRMSALLKEILSDLRAKRVDYEGFLKRIAELAKQVQTGTATGTPEKLDTPGKRALYNNLDKNEDLALAIDETVRRVRPNAFRGNQAKENVIKAALLPLLGKDREEVERIFLIIRAQPEY